MDRHAPFLVVILTVERILPTPPAPRFTGSRHGTFHEGETAARICTRRIKKASE
jgi:hypothetical protein